MTEIDNKVPETKNKLDEIYERGLSNLDNKKMLTTGTEILAYIKVESNPLACSDLRLFIGEIIPWLKSCSPRVSEVAMKILNCFLDRMGTDFRPHLTHLLPFVYDNLSNAKEFLRQENQIFLRKLWTKNLMFPNYMFEKLLPYFTHKNRITRHEVLKLVIAALEEYGSARINLSPLIPPLSTLLNDPYPEIREAATKILSKFYNLMGNKLRLEMQKKYEGHQIKLDVIFKVFDEIDAATANLQATAASIAPPPKPPSSKKVSQETVVDNVSVVGFQAQKLGLSRNMESKVLKHDDEILRLGKVLAKLKSRLDVAETMILSDIDIEIEPNTTVKKSAEKVKGNDPEKDEVNDTAKDEVIDAGKDEVNDTGKDEVIDAGKDEVYDTGKDEVIDAGKDEANDTGKDEVNGTGKDEVNNTGKD